MSEAQRKILAEMTRTGWFADLADEDDRPDGYPWQPFLQDEIGCFPLPVWFRTEEECLRFIRISVVGKEILD